MLKNALVTFSLGFAVSQTVPADNVTVATRACQPPYDKFPFCDVTQSLDARVTLVMPMLLATIQRELVIAKWIHQTRNAERYCNL